MMIYDAVVAVLLISGLTCLGWLLGRNQDNDEMCPSEGGC